MSRRRKYGTLSQAIGDPRSAARSRIETCRRYGMEVSATDLERAAWTDEQVAEYLAEEQAAVDDRAKSPHRDVREEW